MFAEAQKGAAMSDEQQEQAQVRGVCAGGQPGVRLIG